MNVISLYRSSLTLRTLLIFAVPLLLTIIALGYHFTSTYISDVRADLNNRGAFLARHLASVSEFGIYSQDIGELRNIADSMLLERDVVNATILNRLGTTLVSSVNDELLYAGRNHVLFTEPVLRTGVEVSDFNETASGSGPQDSEPVGSVTVMLSEADVLQRENRILLTGVTFTAIGLGLGLLLALVVARTISEPVVRLTGVVRELTSGNLEIRTSERSPGELGMLEQGINQMAASLQGSREMLVNEVNDATAALQATVIELEKRNRDLDQARDEAIRAGAARAEFLARMSHEIRTPLSAVIGFTDLLDQTGQTELQVEYTRTITQAASQLLLVIDDILDFTRMDSSSMRIEYRPFDLHECLENIVSILSKSAHDRQLELVLLIYSDVPRIISSDRDRISQILTNLITNAIKFTDTGHVVVNVSVQSTGEESITLTIAVTDTGIGLSKEQVKTIFEPFIQADVSTSRKYGGTGLGLSISKHLIELLGGDIQVDSSPGKGTTFTFSLPAGLDPGNIKTATRELFCNVLVHDSNPFALRAMRNRFVTWGATVYNTQSPEKLASMVASAPTRYDLVVYGLSAHHSGPASIHRTIDKLRSISDVPLMLLVASDIDTKLAERVSDDKVSIIAKPPRSERVLRNVRMLLDDSALINRPAAPGIRQADCRMDSTRDLRVLIAEDNSYNQSLFRHLLQDVVRDVKMAGNGKEAVAMARNGNYDVIFMDIHMPLMGGIEATRELRKLGLAVPVIALTADVMADRDGELVRCGIDDFLQKPVSCDALVTMLSRWCKVPGPVRTGDADELRRTVELMPDDFRVRLHAELEHLLAAVRTDIMQELPEEMHEHLHQVKGIVDYYQLDEFQSGYRDLREAIVKADNEATLACIDSLQGLLRQGQPADSRESGHID